MAVEFTKEFWQKKRDTSAKGSGVAEALKEWQAKCKPPKTFASAQAFKDAHATADKLKKGLNVA